MAVKYCRVWPSPQAGPFSSPSYGPPHPKKVAEPSLIPTCSRVKKCICSLSAVFLPCKRRPKDGEGTAKRRPIVVSVDIQTTTCYPFGRWQGPGRGGAGRGAPPCHCPICPLSLPFAAPPPRPAAPPWPGPFLARAPFPAPLGRRFPKIIPLLYSTLHVPLKNNPRYVLQKRQEFLSLHSANEGMRDVF